MAQQLVYTSAGKLLDAGRSGFGTVARSKTLSPLLVSAIERVSQFANIRGTDRSRVIFVHRRIIAANNRIHLLSRIADAGADYTGRTNHIAHHLIVTQEEMTRAAARGITPADVLRQFQWLARWEGAPRFYGPEDDVSLERSVQPLGRASARKEWTRLTGNSLHARLLAWDGAPRNGVLLIPRSIEPLPLLAEALAEFGPQSWSRTFTTNLETTDEMSDIDWVVSSPENFREIEARCGARPRLDLSQPQGMPVPPELVASKQGTQETRPVSAASTQPAATSTPQAGPATQVKIRETSTVGRSRSMPLPEAPTKSRKSLAITIAAAAALVLVGVIVWKTIPEKSDREHVSEVRVTPQDRDLAKTILTDENISPEKAEEFVKSVSEDPKAWANYAIRLISKFKPIQKEGGTRSGLEEPPRNRMQGPAWLGYLRDADLALFEYEGLGQTEKLVQQRMDLISKIHDSLSNAAKDLQYQPLSDDDIQSFCVKHAMEVLPVVFGKGDWATYNSEKVESIRNLIKSPFSTQKAFAYEALCKFVRDKFTDFASSVELTKIFNDTGALRRDKDEEFLKEALECWQNPAKQISENLRSSLGKGFVPKDFETILSNKHKSSQDVAVTGNDKLPRSPESVKAPFGHNLSGVKEVEVIVVTREQLEQGVEVALLKACMETKPSAIDLNQNLKIDGEKIEQLVEVEKLAYFSKSWKDSDNATSLKLHKDGTVSIAKHDVVDISISTSLNGKSFEAWIVLDEKNNKPIKTDLKFDFDSKGENSVAVTGDDKKYIFAINPSKNLQCNIEINSQVLQFPIYIKEEVNEVTLQRMPLAKPRIIFSKKDSEEIKNQFEACKTAWNRKLNGSNNEDKEEKIKWVSDATDNFKRAIELAIGGTVLSYEINKEYKDADEIKESDWPSAQKIYLQICGGNKDRAKSQNWEEDINYIKSEIGRIKFDEKFKEIGVKDTDSVAHTEWEKFNPKSSLQKTEKLKDEILNKTRAPASRTHFVEDLKKANKIIICTSSGRVLFEATKN
jgi:hypothetical protein